MSSISVLTAVVAGFLSFVSPCVLPLIPAYISYVSGVSLEDLKEENRNSRRVILNSIAFVIGFSIVFIILGASASAIGSALTKNKKIFDLVAGIIIILFGLHTAGLIRLNFLNYEKKVQVRKSAPSFFNALLLGIAFSFGWTPCVGPILGAILAQASTYDTMSKGIFLLSFYSLGLGIPFILTAFAINKFFAAFKSIKKYFNQVEIFAGLLLVGLGLALVFGIGIHAWYIIGVILLSMSVSVISLEKIRVMSGVSLFIFLVSLLLISGVTFNIETAATLILAVLGILLILNIRKVCKNERT
jgi:cytochrome c-type biogenesis protein